MFKSKKLIVFLLAVIFIFAAVLISCNKNGEVDPEESESTAESTQEDRPHAGEQLFQEACHHQQHDCQPRYSG